ncbi:MAG: ABC transporter substrate-binding protein [Xanthobacteraceae bacterium]|nr:ABC transporter substrate-binding protein [Xanthobacteraceae bacterium]
MRRREFITLLGGVSLAPLTVRAQNSSMPEIGFLHSGSPEQNVQRLAAYRKGLNEAGFVEGENVTIEFRWAAGRNDKLQELAGDLVRRQVAVIATPGSTLAAVVAKAATTSIPIVFAVGADPVGLGLVASFNRPGGNVTGITSLNAEIAAKRFGLIRELVPQAARYFALVNPTDPVLAEPFTKDVQAGAATIGIHIEIIRASTDREIEQAFANFPRQSDSVLVFGPDAFFYTRRTQIAALAAQRAVPTIFDGRDYVEAGGLASYGADFDNLMHLAGGYTGSILKGEKPADLPIVRSTKYELVINLKTANALGLGVPPMLLATADKVIE